MRAHRLHKSLVRGICGSLIRPDSDGDLRSRTGCRPDLTIGRFSSKRPLSRPFAVDSAGRPPWQPLAYLPASIADLPRLDKLSFTIGDNAGAARVDRKISKHAAAPRVSISALSDLLSITTCALSPVSFPITVSPDNLDS